MCVSKFQDRSRGRLEGSFFINYYNRAIGLMSRLFANVPEDRGSIPGRLIQKIKKWYLMLPCLTIT